MHGTRETVGLIGCGRMGQKFAFNLLQNGYELCVYDILPDAVKAVAAKGAFPSSSITELASKSTIVITMLPNDELLTSVVTDATGLLPALQPSSLHLSCSTISPRCARALADQHRAKDLIYVGAPVFARPEGVAARQAIFLVGGTSDGIDRARPILQAMGGSQTFVFGQNDPGAGNVVKLCGNFLMASAIETMAEALALAESEHLDRQDVMQMLSSTIFDCLIYRGYGSRIAVRDHGAGGFPLSLGHKDLQLFRRAAQCAGLTRDNDTPLLHTLCQRFGNACEIDDGALLGQDWTSVAYMSQPASGTSER